MDKELYSRQISLFGEQGQEKLASVRVAVIGVGGLGTHVVQQLAHLGVGSITLVDDEELDVSNKNRYVGSRHSDPNNGFSKVVLGERMIRDINSTIAVVKIDGPLKNRESFEAIIQSDYIFGCLDNDGSRLILNEICCAYDKPYIDLGTEIFPEDPPQFGGRVFVTRDSDGCIYCCDIIDIEEAARDLASPTGRLDRAKLYGVDQETLGSAGPSVVSVNGIVASLAVTEFMVIVTGIRTVKQHLVYRGTMGTVGVSADQPKEDCYYCKNLRGKGEDADIWRYLVADHVGAEEIE